MGLNFQLYDENGKIVAVIGQKILSLHDKYCIDIYQPEHEEKVVAILVTLQHIIYQRAAEAEKEATPAPERSEEDQAIENARIIAYSACTRAIEALKKYYNYRNAERQLKYEHQDTL